MFAFVTVLFAIAAAHPAIAQRGPDHDSDRMAKDLNETVTKTPVTVAILGGRVRSGNMIITHFRPTGPGPFPLVIMSHGRSGSAEGRARTQRHRFVGVARYWVQRGYAVVVPTRLGYGATGVEPDTEYSGRCDNRQFKPMSEGAAHQIATALSYAHTLGWVDRRRTILMGQSVGGLATTVANGKAIPGVVAAINVAGGSGGNPDISPGAPCGPDRLAGNYAAAGKAANPPMLWLYAENDRYWGSSVPRQWHKAYTASGAKATFVMLPPVGADGHRLIDQPDVWQGEIDRFLATLTPTKP